VHDHDARIRPLTARILHVTTQPHSYQHAAHLRRHPEQTTLSMTVSLQRDKDFGPEARSFRMAITRKDSTELYGHGSYWCEEKANLDEKRRRIVAATKSNDAIRCIASLPVPLPECE
jgi:hypothetical protein